MVDVDMADAGSSAPPKGKLVGPAKGKSPESGGLDGKKRFEVKKVGSRLSASKKGDPNLIICTVECCSTLGMGYSCG